jgi:ABC-2 type transport system permease protein
MSVRNRFFKNFSNKAYYWSLSIIVLLIIVLLNIIVSFMDFRVDVTKDQRYSLTSSTIDFLSDEKKFPNRILFKIYLDGDLPAEVKRLRNAIKDKLNEFKYYAGRRVEYEFIDPNIGSPEDQQALKDQLFDKGRGIRPVDIMYRSKGVSKLIEIFPGAVVEYGGVTAGYIRFMEGGKFRLDAQLEDQIQKSINSLEYKFMQSIAKVTRKTKKKVAFIHGQGELGVPFTQGARKNIEDAYIIEDIELEESIHALDEVDAIVIAEPTKPFSDKNKFIIDQFLMRGGSILVAYNPLKIDNDTIRRKGMVHSQRKRTGLEKLVFDYGIKINEDLVVDANYDQFVFPAIPRGFVNWYFYVRALGTDHPISSMVDPVKLPYASSLQFVETNNQTSPAVILTTSSNAKSYGTAPLLSIAIEQTFGENPAFQSDPENPDNRLMLAGLVEGKFQSAFKNRIVATYAEDPDAIFHEESVAHGKLLVVGNGTFFKNSFYDSIFVREKGAYRYIPRYPKQNEIDELLATNYKLGNFDFFENAMDYLLGENTLMSIRSRTIDLHPTDRLKIENYSGFYKFINIFIPVLFILLLAVAMYFNRRLTYAKKNEL